MSSFSKNLIYDMLGSVNEYLLVCSVFWIVTEIKLIYHNFLQISYNSYIVFIHLFIHNESKLFQLIYCLGCEFSCLCFKAYFLFSPPIEIQCSMHPFTWLAFSCHFGFLRDTPLLNRDPTRQLILKNISSELWLEKWDNKSGKVYVQNIL